MPHTTQSPKRIHLLGDGRHEEAVAASVVTPGDLIKRDGNGKAKRHDSAAGHAERSFALEDALQGNTITDDYAADDQVMFVLARPGDVVYAWLASGENVSNGDFLVSNADGKLKASGANTDWIVGIALEDLDLSATGDTDTRIKVRVV